MKAKPKIHSSGLLIAEPPSISHSLEKEPWAPQRANLIGRIHYIVPRNSSLCLAGLTEAICSQISKLLSPVGQWESSRQDRGEKSSQGSRNSLSRSFTQRPSRKYGHVHLWLSFPCSALTAVAVTYSLMDICDHFLCWNSSWSFRLPRRWTHFAQRSSPSPPCFRQREWLTVPLSSLFGGPPPRSPHLGILRNAKEEMRKLLVYFSWLR